MGSSFSLEEVGQVGWARCAGGLSGTGVPGMPSKGAGQPQEELSTGSGHGEQEESKGASSNTLVGVS